MRLRRLAMPEDRYGVVMIGLLVTFVMMGLVDENRWMRLAVVIVLDITLYFTLKTSGARPVLLRFAAGAIGVSLAVTFVQSVLLSRHIPALTFLVVGALSLFTPVFVVMRLLRHPIVTLQTLVGAVVVYVLIGLAFTFLMIACASIQGEQFLSGPDHRSTDLFYLSFITLTTVGFGDVTPGSNLARMIVIIEAVSAQLFLATVIARFASIFSGRGSKPPEEPLVDEA